MLQESITVLTPRRPMLDEGLLVRQVTRRLTQRAKLHEFAKEIHAGISAAMGNPVASDDMLGEQQGGTICGKDPNNPPGDDVRFECSKNDFSCTGKGPAFDCGKGAGSFDCEQVFGDCGGNKDKFDCKSNFDCKGGTGKEDLFDCHDYGCGDSGKDKGSFNCDTKYDFLCAGPAFDCFDDFDCTGGHVFMCVSKNDCVDSFDCASTGSPKCTTDYSRPDDGGDDKTAGDFLCGIGKGGKFDCDTDFDCTAKDEFDCTGTAKFVCKTDFDCAGGANKTNFECDTDFDCVNTSGFDCHCKFSGTDKSK